MDSHRLLDVTNIHSCPFCTYDYCQREEVAIFYPCNHNACNDPCYRDYVAEHTLKHRSFPPCPCCNSDITDVKFVKFTEFTDLTVPNTPDIRSNLPIPEAMLLTTEETTNTIVTDHNSAPPADSDDDSDDDVTSTIATPVPFQAYSDTTNEHPNISDVINTVVKQEDATSASPTLHHLEAEAIDYATTLSIIATKQEDTTTGPTPAIPSRHSRSETRPTPTNLDEAFALEQPVHSPAFYLMETPPVTNNPNHTRHPGNPATNNDEGLLTTYFQGQNRRRASPSTPYDRMTPSERKHHRTIRVSLIKQDRLMSWLSDYTEQDDEDEEIIQELRKAVMNQGNQERCKSLSRLYAAGMWKTPEP